MTQPQDPDATAAWGPDDPDAERTQVLDTREFQPPAPRPNPTTPVAPARSPEVVRTPDVARVDHRGSLAWDLEVARWSNRPSTDLGLLLLRLCSLPLVLRGVHKLLTYPSFIDSLRDNPVAGQAPDVIGTLVMLGELALPLLIVVGFATRLAGLLQATLVVGVLAAWTLPGQPLLQPGTGALTGEAELLYAAVALPLLFTGPGRISLDRALTASGRERRIEKRVSKRLGE